MTRKLTIVQSYVPSYRTNFFEGLRKRLMQLDIDCHVAAGAPVGTQAAREDSVSRDWITPTQRSIVRLGGHTLKWRTSPTPWKDVDGVIVGLEGSSIPVYQALLASRLQGFRVGVWGHAKPYVRAGNKLDLSLEKFQMMKADHVFTYTPGGAEYIASLGIESEKVTTVMNTVDTSELHQHLSSISETELMHFAEMHGVDASRTVCFVGGLDRSKRVDFLAASLDHLWNLDSTIKVLVAGKGQDEHLLRTAYERQQAVPLGYLNGRQKALVLAFSKAICMPGRIGLVAVDALVSGRPILTTDWAYHAPEAEYLVEGESRITAKGDPLNFALEVKNYIDKPQSNTAFPYPSIHNMIENYAHGVVKMLS